MRKELGFKLTFLGLVLGLMCCIFMTAKFDSHAVAAVSGNGTVSGNSTTTVEAAPVEIPKTPENNYGTFQEDAITKVQTAVKNIQKATTNNTSSDVVKGVTLDTNNWVSFKKNVYEEIQKSNIPVTIKFVYKGYRYSVTIPAGADVLSLVDENGYCGFFNLAAHYGFSGMEKR